MRKVLLFSILLQFGLIASGFIYMQKASDNNISKEPIRIQKASDNNISKELIHMQEACDNKIPTACYEFGLLYEEGLGLPKDKAKAKAYYLKACDYGFDKACQKYENIKL